MPNYFSCFLFLFLVSACAQRVERAVKEAKYSAYEAVGLEKRDLFRKGVNEVKVRQKDSGEAFEDALEKLKGIYSFDGGNLERQYSKLKNSYEDAKEEAQAVSGSIQRMDEVASDLFQEWQQEIESIKSQNLKDKSSQKLTATKKNFDRFMSQLKISEDRIRPVLSRLSDQVLFLKHNLNAQGVSGMKQESLRIQEDISRLIKEMEESIQEADGLIKTL